MCYTTSKAYKLRCNRDTQSAISIRISNIIEILLRINSIFFLYLAIRLCPYLLKTNFSEPKNVCFFKFNMVELA